MEAPISPLTIGRRYETTIYETVSTQVTQPDLLLCMPPKGSRKRAASPCTPPDSSAASEAASECEDEDDDVHVEDDPSDSEWEVVTRRRRRRRGGSEPPGSPGRPRPAPKRTRGPRKQQSQQTSVGALAPVLAADVQAAPAAPAALCGSDSEPQGPDSAESPAPESGATTSTRLHDASVALIATLIPTTRRSNLKAPSQAPQAGSASASGQTQAGGAGAAGSSESAPPPAPQAQAPQRRKETLLSCAPLQGLCVTVSELTGRGASPLHLVLSGDSVFQAALTGAPLPVKIPHFCAPASGQSGPGASASASGTATSGSGNLKVTAGLKEAESGIASQDAL